jgi:hypothetical protein
MASMSSVDSTCMISVGCVIADIRAVMWNPVLGIIVELPYERTLTWTWP